MILETAMTQHTKKTAFLTFLLFLMSIKTFQSVLKLSAVGWVSKLLPLKYSATPSNTAFVKIPVPVNVKTITVGVHVLFCE